MTEPSPSTPATDADVSAADEDARPLAGGLDLDAIPPRLWAIAWLISLGAAALLLLTGDPTHTPWASIAALLLGAAAVIGALVAARSSISAPFPPAPVLQPAPALPAGGGGDEREELAQLQALMGDLPELGLLMDRDGRAEVVFGRALAGVSAEALHAGVIGLAAPDDRRSLGGALAQAWAGRQIEAVFALDADPDRRLRLSARKTAQGALAGILTEAAAPAAAPSAIWAPSTPVVAAAADLAQARDAQQAAEAERDAAVIENANKSRFLANMSHELRTPLNAILGFSDIMRIKLFGPLPERYAEYAELIHESGRHLTDLINDVLDMSKIEADRYALHKEVFDACDPVGGALKLLRLQAEDKGVTLRGDLPPEPLEVDADRRALKQIVINLVANAIKFTPPEGRVDVTLRALDGALELTVADTGEGIAPEDLKRLGQPYAQTDAGRRAQGTGLGLSLVKALTALHGGEFLLESRLGEGSAATVRLPVLVQGETAKTTLV